MLTEEKSQLEEKNDNSTGNTISIASYTCSVYFSLEEVEKLKAKVVDSETYIATLTEEKTLTNGKTTLYHSITV